MIRTPLLTLAALAGITPGLAQTLVLPEIGLQSSGACRNLTVRDRASNAQVAIGCVDTATPGRFRFPFTRSAAGAVARDLAGKLQDLPLTPQDMGAVADGTTPADGAFAALASVPGTVDIPPGSYRLTRSQTWPGGRAYRIAAGALILPDAGVTITIKGEVQAPDRRIFGGLGAVVGITVSRPVWWGAVGTHLNTVDSRDAIQAAVNSAAASFGPKDPNNPSDGRRPTVEFGAGFYRACSPIDIHPLPTKPLTIQGRGTFNSAGLEACAAFKGEALLQVHGAAEGSGDGSWDLHIKDLLLANPTRDSGITAGIRFVPEGAGHGLNSGNVRPSIVQNVLLQGFPVGLDIVNTLQLKVDRVTYQGTGTRDNLGARVRTLGSGATAQAGSIIFSSFSTDPCPPHNANLCTNTVGISLEATSDPSASTAGIIIESNSILWGSNTPLRIRAGGGAYVGDVWLTNTQMDGFSCQFIDAVAEGAGSRIFNVHVDHNYHTGAASTNCTAYSWTAQGGGSIFNLWITNNQFELGPSSAVVNLGNVQDAFITGNKFAGGGRSAGILVGNGSRRVVIANNVLRQVNPSWVAGIAIDTDTDQIAVQSNIIAGVASPLVDASTGTNNIVGDDGQAWRPYPATLRCDFGNGTATAAVIGRYKLLGAKTVAVSLRAAVTDLGSCGGNTFLSLPFAALDKFAAVMFDQGGSIDRQLAVNAYSAGTSEVVVRRVNADGTYATGFVKGSDASASFTYERP